MSFRYTQDGRRRQVGPPAAGPRSVMGYWMPLVLTVGVATIGIAAWIWSEQSDEDDDDYYPPDDSGDESYYAPRPRPPPAGHPPPPPPPPPPQGYGREISESTESTALYRDLPTQSSDDSGMFARMQGALRRTPSPQDIFGGASKRVAAGMAAAGAFVGLAPIREEGRGDFEDHTRWSEEAESRDNESNRQASPAVMSGALPSSGRGLGKKRKTVVIVVSSMSHGSDESLNHAVCCLSLSCLVLSCLALRLLSLRC